jgi:hypothetical protein
MSEPTNLTAWLTEIKGRIAERPRTVPGLNGETCQVTYDSDEDGAGYALVEVPALPNGVCAEIDGDTYGSLVGFRFYDPALDPDDEDEAD